MFKFWWLKHNSSENLKSSAENTICISTNSLDLLVWLDKTKWADYHQHFQITHRPKSLRLEKPHTYLQAPWIMCLFNLPSVSRNLIFKWNGKCTFIWKDDFGSLSSSPVVFFTSPGKETFGSRVSLYSACNSFGLFSKDVSSWCSNFRPRNQWLQLTDLIILLPEVSDVKGKQSEVQCLVGDKGGICRAVEMQLDRAWGQPWGAEKFLTALVLLCDLKSVFRRGWQWLVFWDRARKLLNLRNNTGTQRRTNSLAQILNWWTWEDARN